MPLESADGYTSLSDFAGRGLKVRTRLYMVSPQQQTSAECSEQLMEKSECEGARPDCEFSAEDARLICGMKKEVPRFYTVMIGCCYKWIL